MVGGGEGGQEEMVKDHIFPAFFFDPFDPVHLGIARLGGGLNPCQDGLWHLFLASPDAQEVM